jgi:TPR repeat protein
MTMTFIHAPTCAAPIFAPVATPVVTNASVPLANPFPDIRRWLTALLLLTAIYSIGSRAASADIEIVLPGHSYADASIKAPVEAGIIAAKSGRLQDAITILTPHANMGHTTAKYILGLIYLRDRGALVARPVLSHRHFARAAATGHVASMFEAAFQFERGIGTTRDMNRAVQLNQIAARTKHLNAQFNLAVLLSHAKAKREDLQQAYFWAIAAQNNAFKTGDDRLKEASITRLVTSIRSRIPHAAAAKASTAAAKLTGQPV